MPPHADVLQWEHLPFPKSLRDFQRLFPNDERCAAYLEGAKWPKGFVCPHCSEKGEPFRMATRDVVIILYRLAERMGVDLHEEIDAKMEINRKRQWAVTADGHGYHVRNKGLSIPSQHHQTQGE